MPHNPRSSPAGKIYYKETLVTAKRLDAELAGAWRRRRRRPGMSFAGGRARLVCRRARLCAQGRSACTRRRRGEGAVMGLLRSSRGSQVSGVGCGYTWAGGGQGRAAGARGTQRVRRQRHHLAALHSRCCLVIRPSIFFRPRTAHSALLALGNRMRTKTSNRCPANATRWMGRESAVGYCPTRPRAYARLHARLGCSNFPLVGSVGVAHTTLSLISTSTIDPLQPRHSRTPHRRPSTTTCSFLQPKGLYSRSTRPLGILVIQLELRRRQPQCASLAQMHLSPLLSEL
ncbi:hypothetical protein PENSPDRAFT_241873 [Peniophora sp. CONT]|nr:hypothetical protein PENSPDRAFT_241873 [Peniophora sp. CONT]